MKRNKYLYTVVIIRPNSVDAGKFVEEEYKTYVSRKCAKAVAGAIHFFTGYAVSIVKKDYIQ